MARKTTEKQVDAIIARNTAIDDKVKEVRNAYLKKNGYRPKETEQYWKGLFKKLDKQGKELLVEVIPVDVTRLKIWVGIVDKEVEDGHTESIS